VAAGLAVFLLAPSWTPQSSGVTVRLRGVSAVSDRVAWASGEGNTILRTEDGGTTWKKLAKPTAVAAERLDFRDVDAVSATTAYVLSIGAGTLSRIYKTTDAGLTWTMQFANADADAFFDAMAFWDADHGIAVSDTVKGTFVIITTEDGGRSWNRVPADRLPPALDNEGAFAASGTNVTVSGTSHAWFGTGAAARARVLHTPDRGRTWTIAETPLRAGQTSGIYSIAFRDEMNGVVVGGDYSKDAEAIDNAAVTKDGGKTWTLVTGLTGFRSVVAYVPGQRTALLAVGSQGADISADDGRTGRRSKAPASTRF
jgi:photosystem II stability/assembly factor-like uncharacterized protein